MKITPDTNILVRAAIAADDPESEDAQQAREAMALLDQADLIAITTPALCEFVWVLRRVYKHAPHAICQAIQSLCASAAVVCDRPIVEAGLRWLDVGGDFADGAIAALGRQMGADLFVSFDQRAVQLAHATGHHAEFPSNASDKPAAS